MRESDEIGRLLSRAYRKDVPVDRLMSGLAAVASALNANDPCLARIAAVHLRIPDLPDHAARDGLEAEDSLIKYAGEDWDPAKHPRTGTPPNPGWFAPTDGEAVDARPTTQTAQNEDRTQRSDVTPSPDDRRAKLPPGERIDELAKPEDEKAIRREIKKYYYDVGRRFAGDMLNQALTWTLDPSTDLKPDRKFSTISKFIRAPIRPS